MKKLLFSLFLIIFLSGCSSVAVNTNQNSSLTIPAGMIYFHSSTCPHCANVNSYIEQNNIKQKLFFVSKEINSDKSAYDLAKLVGQKCGISESNLGVPLFWDGQKCYLGDEDIINFLKIKQ